MEYTDVCAQLKWEPTVEGGAVSAPRKVVVGGMGGSALPGEALRVLDPALDLEVDRGFGLPLHAPEDALYVALSYSGNTEETLAFASVAKGRPRAAVTSGGVLLEYAQREGMPYVVVPGGVEPRNALVYMTRALLKLLERNDLLAALGEAAPEETHAQASAESLANTVGDRLPLFYSSQRNAFFSYVYKINFNETGKMPAFCNTFPELAHNEMEAFDAPPSGGPEASTLARFVLLRDYDDDPKVHKYMDIFIALMRERSYNVFEQPLVGGTRAEQLVWAWFVAHRAARACALARGADPERVSIVEEFKKRLAS